MIRLTKLTRNIIYYIEEVGFATSYQIGMIFFKDTKFPVEASRRKLKLLSDNGLLESMNVNYAGKELFYYPKGKKKTVSYHRYLLQNLYANIYNFGDEVLYFKSEETWSISNKRNDGHIIFKYNNSIYSYMIEVDINHATQHDKYIEIYDSKEVQAWYQAKYGTDDFFPDVLIINALGTNKVETNEEFEVIGLDYNLKDLIKKII